MQTDRNGSRKPGPGGNGSRQQPGQAIAGTAMGMVLILGLAVICAIGIARSVNAFGARVGDIVSFDRGVPVPNELQSRIEARALGANGAPVRSCILDTKVMAASGGSLIVERRDLDAEIGDRVHWAGRSSSVGAADCGGSAELMLSDSAVQSLAAAAGGFGVGEKHLSFASLQQNGAGHFVQ